VFVDVYTLYMLPHLTAFSIVGEITEPESDGPNSIVGKTTEPGEKPAFCTAPG